MPVKVYDGTNWVTVAGDGQQGAAGASGTAPLTTKGDLLGFDTAANRVAVGTNGQTLVADSTATTGIRWQDTYAAGKNKIINGDFAINQRNFTSNTTTGTYGFDRFKQANSGGTCTVTPQTFALGTAPVSGYEGKNFCRLVTASQSAAGDYAALEQMIESVRTFAGQTVTFSCWAKASSGTPLVGFSAVQFFGTGGSPSANTITSGGTATISTSWARYSFTVAIPSISGKTIGTNNDDKVQLDLWTSVGTTISGLGYPAVGIQNVTIDTWGWQVEAGSVATPFTTATGTIQGELAACQRYCYVQSYLDASNLRVGMGGLETTTQAGILVKFPVTMRTKPTLTVVSQTAFTLNTYAVQVATSTIALSGSVNQTLDNADLTVTFAATGAAGNVCRLFIAGSSSLTYSAEL
jgi:hypothetical protein